MGVTNSRLSAVARAMIDAFVHPSPEVCPYRPSRWFFWLGTLVEYGPTPTIFQIPHLKETEDYVTGRFG